jgi:uncharacterized metal-binding protein
MCTDSFPGAINTPVDLVDRLQFKDVDILICGGISTATREAVQSHGIDIVDNVACSVTEILEAIQMDRLRPGYGMTDVSAVEDVDKGSEPSVEDEAIPTFNCLKCMDRKCVSGQPCLDMSHSLPGLPRVSRRMLDAALDVSQDKDRVLCRVSELVYFCLEMSFRRIGVAYCTDLWEPAEILTGVLRRFFEITPVCCKIGGVTESEMLDLSTAGEGPIVCNPVGQAEVLNRAGTQLNVIVGLCLGADCLFTSASDAPVTTLVVKDRSLAHNPIGALYSEYYLKESLQATEQLGRAQKRTEGKPVTSATPIQPLGVNKQEESS